MENITLEECRIPYGLPEDWGTVYFGVVRNSLFDAGEPAQKTSALAGVLTDLAKLRQPVLVVLPASEFVQSLNSEELQELADTVGGNNIKILPLFDVPGTDWFFAVPRRPEEAMSSVIAALRSGASCVVLSTPKERSGFVPALLAIHRHPDCHMAKIMYPVCKAEEMKLTAFQQGVVVGLCSRA